MASERRVGTIRFVKAIWLPRSTGGQMVDGRLRGSRLGGLKTSSAVHRGFQMETLTGNEGEMCFLVPSNNNTGIYFE